MLVSEALIAFGPKLSSIKRLVQALLFGFPGMALRPNMHSASTLLAGLSALLGQNSEEEQLTNVATDLRAKPFLTVGILAT